MSLEWARARLREIREQTRERDVRGTAADPTCAWLGCVPVLAVERVDDTARRRLPIDQPRPAVRAGNGLAFGTRARVRRA